MPLSVLDLFRIGIGPSSSHTVGPMRAALRFARALDSRGLLERTEMIRVELLGSLGATGRGHGSDRAVIAGLAGEEPETVDPEAIPGIVEEVRRRGALRVLGRHAIRFGEDSIAFLPSQRLPAHPNGMRFTALAQERTIAREEYYSIGGGFIVGGREGADGAGAPERPPPPLPFSSAAELLAHCDREGSPVSGVMMANERSWLAEETVRRRLLELWEVMRACIERGMRSEGTLPGVLRLERRAPGLRRRIEERDRERARGGGPADPIAAMERVDMYALAVAEENAAGGRVVTAPTNGAAGILPAVLRYHEHVRGGLDEEEVVRYLLAAGAIGILYKENASISGAEVGCQGEIGSACSMAAGAIAELLGGTPRQVENAAEIGMEHHLGLTCDPVAGLVQVPCIERNAVAAVQAINAAHLALQGPGKHIVSLDTVIKTMRETGADMKAKYKETAAGGLAVNVTVC